MSANNTNNFSNLSTNSVQNKDPVVKTKMRPQDRPILSSLYRRMNCALTSKADKIALSTLFKRFEDADLKDLSEKDAMGRKMVGSNLLLSDRMSFNAHLLEAKVSNDPDSSLRDMLPSNAYEERLNYILFDGDLRTKNVLQFKKMAKKSSDSYLSNHEILKNIGLEHIKSPVKESIAHEPIETFKCNILDDFYLNLIDFSTNHWLALGVDKSVFIWNRNVGKSATRLSSSIQENEFVSSISWSPCGQLLAIGSSDGTVEINNFEKGVSNTKINVLMGRIACLSWNGNILSCGTKSGIIYNYDMRKPKHHICSLKRHELEVCGLRWNSDGTRLASGGNDDLVCVWEFNSTKRPLNSFRHNAAVKAIDWYPLNNSILATGGGTDDKKIRIFNVDRGTELFKTDTGCQVSAVFFSKHSNELFSTQGYDKNDISVWKLPNLEKSYSLRAHSERILSMTMTPDGTELATASTDSTLKIWSCARSEQLDITKLVDPIDKLHSLIR